MIVDCRDRCRCSKASAFIYLGIFIFAFVTREVVGQRDKISEHYDDEQINESGSGSGSGNWFQRTTTPSSNLSLDCPSEYFGNDSSMLWSKTRQGEVAITNKPCILPNGLPLMRRCESQMWRGYWENITKTPADCVTVAREKLITTTLVELEEQAFVNKTIEPPQAVKRLKDTLRKTRDFKLIPTDVFYTARIVERAVEKNRTQELCVDLLSILNRLMNADREILRATAFLNSTNSLLENFERCADATFGHSSTVAIAEEEKIERVLLSELGVRAHLSMNLSVFHVDPAVANVSGIALYDKPSDPSKPGMFREAFGDFYYRLLYFNQTVDGLMTESDLEMATFVPYDLWTSLTSHLKQPALIVKVYSNDMLFMEPRLQTKCAVFSKIASLTIPGVSNNFPGLLPIIFRSHYTKRVDEANKIGCSYWEYNYWTNSGIEVIRDYTDNGGLIACGTHHMTQFAYLIGGDYRYNDFSNSVVITRVHMRALNIITLVGCTLSILGLLGIFITSLVFKSWRSRPSTKVLLHLSTAIIFQMILFCFVNTHDMTVYLMQNKDYGACIAIGALLQYSVLVQFMWMLIIAFLQFQRYVQVFGSRPEHFILKSALVGWGLPIIPPAILIAVDRTSYIPYYNRDSSLMCYPANDGLNYGVILPISLIISANLVIFAMVLWNIRQTLESASKRNEKQKVLQQIRLMVMMFFLFGFSWIFGLLAAMDAGIAFSYLFCITATLQGFVLFVYFVILDPSTRILWYQICCDPDAKLKSSEVAELRMSST